MCATSAEEVPDALGEGRDRGAEMGNLGENPGQAPWIVAAVEVLQRRRQQDL